MRNASWSFFIIVLICFSCKKADNNLLVTDGTYTGTFRRFAGDTVWISNVSITFSAGKWTGQGDSAKYPALCNGTYIVNGENNIKFQNACPWTLDFDHTYILDGQFHLEITDSSLTIERNYAGNVIDRYRLRKP